MDCAHGTPAPLTSWLGSASGGPQQEAGEAGESGAGSFFPLHPTASAAWVLAAAPSLLPRAWGHGAPALSLGPPASPRVNKPASIVKPPRVRVFLSGL